MYIYINLKLVLLPILYIISLWMSARKLYNVKGALFCSATGSLALLRNFKALNVIIRPKVIIPKLLPISTVTNSKLNFQINLQLHG